MGNKIEGAEKNEITEINQRGSPFKNEYLVTSLPSQKMFINDLKYYPKHDIFVTISQITRSRAPSKRDKVTVLVIFWKHLNNQFKISKSFKIIHPFTNYSSFGLNSCLKSSYLFMEFCPYSIYGQQIFAFDLFNDSESNFDPKSGSMKAFCSINLGRARYNVFSFNNKKYLLKYDMRVPNFRSLVIHAFPSAEVLLDYRGDGDVVSNRSKTKEILWWWRTKAVQNCDRSHIIYVLSGFITTLHFDQVNLQKISVVQLSTFNLDSYGFIKWDISADYAETFKSFTIKGTKVSPNGMYIIVVTNERFFILSTETGDVLWKSDIFLFGMTHKNKPWLIENISPHGGNRAYIDWYKTNECMIYLNGYYYQCIVIHKKILIDIFEDCGLSMDVITILLQFCANDRAVYRVHNIICREKTDVHKHLKVGGIHVFYTSDNEIKMVSRRGVWYSKQKKDSKQKHALFELETYTVKSG